MSFYIQYDDKLPTSEELYNELIMEAIFKNNSVEEAAVEIGLSARTLYRYLKKMDLSVRQIRNLDTE